MIAVPLILIIWITWRYYLVITFWVLLLCLGEVLFQLLNSLISDHHLQTQWKVRKIGVRWLVFFASREVILPLFLKPGLHVRRKCKRMHRNVQYKRSESKGEIFHSLALASVLSREHYKRRRKHLERKRSVTFPPSWKTAPNAHALMVILALRVNQI